MKRALIISAIVFATAVSTDAQDKDRPKEFTNGLGMKFVWIPPGQFQMGSPKDEKQRSPDEHQHKITLSKGFYMAVTLVTQEQWKEVMEKNPSMFAGEKNLPVDSVTWNECQDFLKKLKAKDKKAYRLPTEAEWEYACRAGTTTPYSFGETITAKQANFLDSEIAEKGKKDLSRFKTTPVGAFPANAWGLHDMHANLWQWCQDWYGEYPQKDVADPQGPMKGPGRVARGGSWFDRADRCRSAARRWADPAVRDYSVGFRVCFFAD